MSTDAQYKGTASTHDAPPTVPAPPEYDPRSFRSLYETDFCRVLQRFLNRDENIIRMETAVQLGRTPAEPLAPFLLDEFGEEVKTDRVKQMVGHMMRHILEGLGFHVDRNGVRIPRSEVFTSATRYRHGSFAERLADCPPALRRVFDALDRHALSLPGIEAHEERSRGLGVIYKRGPRVVLRMDPKPHRGGG